MKYCCVTPCFNAGDDIEVTVRSVMAQSALKDPANSIHFIIQDGGSKDRTRETVAPLVDDAASITNLHIEFVSQPDTGMYDALAKGLGALSDGEIYSYINAGDYYSPFAFEIAGEIFANYDVAFLTGMACTYNAKNHLVRCILPYRFVPSLMLKGLYGRQLPFLQQESTFWRGDVHANIDLTKLASFSYAGDFFLWVSLIRQAPLYIVEAWLAGFKRQAGQLSVLYGEEYHQEMAIIAARPNLFDRLRAAAIFVLWQMPNKLKRILNSRIFYYDHSAGKYVTNRRGQRP